ncbi:casein kinase 1-like protein 1 [Lycium ferocissimum]|uniref:casein kinase 1-like protein 1 n=1 Tax=Lycium ferocissimum TaxID=112874 RepID=UPI0028155280|nr:casein kinase 1-like protein 1 [Lycium ferocissimum]
MEGRVVGNKYLLDRKIGRGTFSEIYHGTDIHTHAEVAVKMEKFETQSSPKVLYEAKLYGILQGGTGIPNTRCFGVERNYIVLVMDLLGPSLESSFNFFSRKFSLKTILMLADQMINCIEFVHSKSFLHQDIKPADFLVGLGRHAQQVYIIDFGLAKRYRNPSSHEHIPYRVGKKFSGNPKYASMYTHLGFDKCRRDDLESLGYVLMHFLRGSLPWEGIKAVTEDLKREKIGRKKASTSIEELCQGYPTEFASYFNHCRSLKFEDEPDYANMKRMFRDLFFREGFQLDYVFGWTHTATPPSRPTLGPGAGAALSSNIPPAIPNAERLSGEEGRQSADPIRRSSSWPLINAGSLPGQRSGSIFKTCEAEPQCLCH